MLNIDDEYYMRQALHEASRSLSVGDVPVGAVVVCNGEILSAGFNQVEHLADPTAHAEIIAIRNAVGHVGYKHLLECTLYTTLEPCCMCAGAIVLARIPRLVIGADDPKNGASGSLYSITDDERLNHRCQVDRGILKDECSSILKDFFRNLRLDKDL